MTPNMLKVHAHMLTMRQTKWTRPDIAKACKLTNPQARRALEALAEGGFITKHRFKSNGRPYYLALIPQEVTE